MTSLNLSQHARSNQQAPSEQVLNRASHPDYWLELNPGLRITENPFTTRHDPYAVESDQVSRAVEQIRAEGYARFEPIISTAETKLLASAISRVAHAGFPGPLAIVYDEIWALLARLSGVLAPILGPAYSVSPDLWIYHVDGQREAAGWSIHRDDEMDRWTLDENNTPMLVTLWIPLTDATPENSCIYVLPTHLDPNFPDNLEDWKLRQGAESDIRALPVQAGSVLLWNQYLLHWGSRHSRWAKEPRISLAIYVQSNAVAPFSVRPASESAQLEEAPTPKLVDLRRDLSFEDRLGSAGRMVWKYRKIVPYPENVLSFCAEHGQRYMNIQPG